METFIVVVLFLGFFVLLGWLITKAMDSDSLFNPFSFASFLMAAIGLTVLIYAAEMEESKGPCLNYETQIYWNSATKTMMPARVCTQRAEWIKE